MTPLALLSCLATLAGAPAPDADYNLDPDAWNGFGYFLQTASEARVDVTTHTSIDLAVLDPEDTLLIIYPTRPLPTDDLLAFVESGGDLIIADDGGTSGPLLARLGIERTLEGPRAHLRYANGEEGFPIVKVTGEHFLFFHVDEVVANHPATLALTGVPGTHPILSFENGREHLIVEARRGDGEVLAIADPSMFLNEMLRRFYGNKQFAANVLRFYCAHEPCKLLLALPGADYTNHFDRQRARLGDLPRDLTEAIDAMNEALADASADLAAPPLSGAIPVVPIALAITILGVLLTFIRRQTRAPTLSAFVGPAERGIREPSLRRPPASLAPSVEDALGLVVQRDHADFVGLALTLADQATELLRVVGDAPRASPEIRAAIVRVQAEAAGLRTRQPPRVSADRFLSFYEDVQVLARHAHGPRRAMLRPQSDAASVSAPRATPPSAPES